MTTFALFVIFDMNEVTMAVVTGWQGVFIVLGYLFAAVWDCLAIGKILER